MSRAGGIPAVHGGEDVNYGNWITHGSQVEEDAARSCVAAALDEGITASTPRTCTREPAPKRSWDAPWPAPAVNRSRSSPRCTGRPAAARTTGACPASTSSSRYTARCAVWAPTTLISTRRTGMTTRRRWKRPCGPSRTWSGRARRCTSGCPSGGPRRSRRPCGSPGRWASTGSCRTSRSTTCCGGSSSPRSSRCARTASPASRP